MAKDTLQPGAMVIPLAGLVRTAAVVSTSLSFAIGEWVLHRAIVGSLVGLVLGGLAGWIVGGRLGGLLYSAPGGSVLVVKAGRAGLPATLKAACAGAIISSVAVAAVLMYWAPPDRRLAVGVASVLVGMAIGVVWGTGAALL